MSIPTNNSPNGSPNLLQRLGNAMLGKAEGFKEPTPASVSTNSMMRGWEEKVAAATDRQALMQIQEEASREISRFLEQNQAQFQDKDGTTLATISTSLLQHLNTICETRAQLLVAEAVATCTGKIEKLGTDILHHNDQDPVQYYAEELQRGKNLLADLKKRIVAITENDQNPQIATAEKIFNSRIEDIANNWIKAEEEFLKGAISMYGEIIDAPIYLKMAQDRSDKLAVMRALPRLLGESLQQGICINHRARKARLEGLRAFAPSEMHNMIDQSIQAYSYLQEQVAELTKNRTDYARNETLRRSLQEIEFELGKLLDEYKQLTSDTTSLLAEANQGKPVTSARLIQLKEQIVAYERKLNPLFPRLNALAEGLEISFERNGESNSSEISSLTPQRAVLNRLSAQLGTTILDLQIAEWEKQLKKSVTLFKGGVLDHPEIYQQELGQHVPEDGILQAGSNLLMQWRRFRGRVATEGSAFSYGGIREVSDSNIKNIRVQFQAARGDTLGPVLQQINDALKTCQEKDKEKLIALQKRFTAENWAKDLYAFLADAPPDLGKSFDKNKLNASIIERTRQVFLDLGGHLPAETVNSITYAALRMVNHANLTDRQLLDQLMPLLGMIKEVVEAQPVGERGHPDFLEVIQFLQDYDKACKDVVTGKVSIGRARKLEHRYYLLPITIPAIEVVDKARKSGRSAIVTSNLLAVADLGRDTSGDFRFNCRLCNLTAVGNTQWFKFPRRCLDWLCAAGRWLYSWISSEQSVVTPVKQATDAERRAIPSGVMKVDWSQPTQEEQPPANFDASKLHELSESEMDQE